MVRDAGNKAILAISAEAKDMASREMRCLTLPSARAPMPRTHAAVCLRACAVCVDCLV